MKNLAFLASLFLSVAAFAQDAAVRSIDIYVTPYYSANDGKVEYVRVYDKIDALLASGKREDFERAVGIVQDAPQMVTPMTLFVISARAYDLGLRDEAVFWFYNAKNRAILLREVVDLDNKMFFETKSAIGAFISLVGDVVNPYAFCDIKNQQNIAARSLEWTKANTYEAVFLEQFPSKRFSRSLALKSAIKKLEKNNKEEREYFNDPKNLAEFKAQRQKYNTDERFCRE